MPIVGGLDIHRKQITFDYLYIVTGEARPDRPGRPVHLRAWLARFAGHDDVAFAVEGCAGWRYVAEELAAAGIAAHLAEPAGTVFARGRKRHAKTGKTGARHLRMLLAEARLQECWIPPARILECRALLKLYNFVRRERTAGRTGSTRCCSARAPRRWARARCAPGRAWPGCGPRQSATCRRPGSCRSLPRWR